MHVTTQRTDAGPPPTGQDRRLRQLLLALGVVVALGVAVTVTWAITSDNGGGPGPGASPTATQAPSGGPTSEPAPTPSSPVSPSASGAPVPVFGYQPLWPFPTTAAATTWQLAYRTSGVQPWHLDPGLTALGFTTGHLGFTEVNQETSRRIVGREAWIRVGHHQPDGHMGTAAVVHLARMGAGGDAPWEVVGTQDSTLSITAPAYGASVSSPLTAGGRITGVDEALRVAVIDAQRPDARSGDRRSCRRQQYALVRHGRLHPAGRRSAHRRRLHRRSRRRGRAVRHHRGPGRRHRMTHG